jgi:hypothetical protein
MSRQIVLPAAPGQRMETRDRGGMLVATKTCIVKGEDGIPERLKAGQTFVVTGHWLAQTYPDLFAADQAERARPRAVPSEADELKRELQIRKQTIGGRPATRKLNLPLPSEPKKWKPLVRFNPTAEPDFTVTLSSNARSLMAELAFLARGAYETGGALFGPAARSSSGKGEVRIAGEPGPAARSWRSTMKPDLEHIRREAGELERSGSDLRWVGHWHTHPSGDGQPSPGDLEFFAADCREQTLHGHPLEHYVALILTPRRDWHRHDHEPYMSWAKPMLHAWHMRQLSDDQFTCRRAVIADEGQSQWRL